MIDRIAVASIMGAFKGWLSELAAGEGGKELRAFYEEVLNVIRVTEIILHLYHVAHTVSCKSHRLMYFQTSFMHCNSHRLMQITPSHVFPSFIWVM